MSDGEVEVANWKQEEHGLTLFIKIGGYSRSSTRTELAAAIVTMAAHGPIHPASDSQAFVKAANALMNKIAKSNESHQD